MKVGDWVVPTPGSPQFYRHDSMFYICTYVEREGINAGNVSIQSLDKQDHFLVLKEHVDKYTVVDSRKKKNPKFLKVQIEK